MGRELVLTDVPASLLMLATRRAVAQKSLPSAPTTDDELWEYARDILGVTIPRESCCDEHTPPFTAFADAYFARSSMSVWKASRGFGGKSMMLACLAMLEALALQTQVFVLGGSSDQSENVVRYTDGMVNLPSFPKSEVDAIGGKRRTFGLTKARITLASGGKLTAAAASTRAVRGPHPTRLRVDEADELALMILDAALGQTMAKNDVPAQTVLSSTHHYADGTMTEILKRAGDNGWPVYEWCYRCTSKGDGAWLDESEIERKRSEVPKSMWDAEYDLQEPAPESRAIVPDAVDALFDRELGDFEGVHGEVVELEKPVESGKYSTGADWGKKQDWTVIVTIRHDCDPARVVAFQRMQRLPWPIMTAAFDSQALKYRGTACHDETGVGSGMHDMLESGADGVQLIGKRRTRILSRYISAVERGELVSPMVRSAFAEHKYASVDDVYGSGHLPDTFCAFALAWRGADAPVWEVYDD